MARVSNASRRNILLISAALLLCGFLHVLLYGADFFQEFSRLFCGAVTAAWGVSVVKRVTDKRLLHILLAIFAVLLLFLFLQTINYNYAQGVSFIRRYAWYGYYFCMMAFAVLMYELSLSFTGGGKKKGGGLRFLLPASGVLLTVGVMTNDLHQLAFRFNGTEMLPESPKSYGLLFYLYYIYFSILLLLSFFCFCSFRRSTITTPKACRLFAAMHGMAIISV